MGRCVAGGSRPEGVDFARIDPPEFFSAPATHFLASRSAATYEDSIILGVAEGPRGNPWGPNGGRGPVAFKVETNEVRNGNWKEGNWNVGSRRVSSESWKLKSKHRKLNVGICFPISGIRLFEPAVSILFPRKKVRKNREKRQF